MSKLEWDKTGERFYEMGAKKGVLYPMSSSGTYPSGVAWNGLTSVNESPSGAEATKLYADDIQYAVLRSAEEYGFTIEAYTYPDEFMACDGSQSIIAGLTIGQQKRQAFGFSYVTQLGNDTASEADDGYKIHIIYGATASPSSKDHATINDSPDAVQFSWECEATPVSVTGYKPCCTIEIDSTKIDSAKLTLIENALYGTDSTEATEGHEATAATDPHLPLPNELISLVGGNSNSNSGNT